MGWLRGGLLLRVRSSCGHLFIRSLFQTAPPGMNTLARLSYSNTLSSVYAKYAKAAAPFKECAAETPCALQAATVAHAQWVAVRSSGGVASCTQVWKRPRNCVCGHPAPRHEALWKLLLLHFACNCARRMGLLNGWKAFPTTPQRARVQMPVTTWLPLLMRRRGRCRRDA